MKKFPAGILVCAVLAGFTPGLSGQQPASLDREAQQLFEKRCAECHGRDLDVTQRKGNKQMFLDARSTRAELNNSKAIIPGNPADSSIIQKVMAPADDDRMPPKGPRLTTVEVALLRLWIAGDAPDAGGGPPPSNAIKRADLLKAGHADLSSAPAGSRRYLRYLSLHNLRNAGDSPAALNAYRAAVSKTLNSLSSEPRIAAPVALGPENILLRLDVRDYGWDVAHWDMLAAAYPYDIEPAVLTKTELETRQLAGTVLPVIRADWFVFAATQSPFYEKLLSAAGHSGGLPNSDAQLEQQLGIHALQNIRGGRVRRAVFTDSGVSDSNRIVERHALAQGGYYWKSYDFANERGAGDLVRNPLGPPEAGYRNAFQHDGGEIIWSLPNGMQGYLLSTAKGNVITRGPTGIVKDPEGPQGAVINGVSCMRCHSAGMRQPKGGEANVASTHVRARGGLNANDQEIFDRLHRDAATMTRQINDDGARFKEASRKAGVTEEMWFTQADEPVGRLYARFRADITARTLASELDMDTADVRERLKEYDGAGDAQINSLIQRLPKGIKRPDFIADFALLGRVFERGVARRFTPVLFEEFRESKDQTAIAGANVVESGTEKKSINGPLTNSAPSRLPPYVPTSILIEGMVGEEFEVLKFDLEVIGFRVVNSGYWSFKLGIERSGAKLNGFLKDKDKLLLGKSFTTASANPRVLAHALSDAVVQKVTDLKGVARSRIAYTAESGGGRDIFIADFDGHNSQAMTKGESLDTLTWAKNKLLYKRRFDGVDRIVLHEIETGERRLVGPKTGKCISCAISPDATMAAIIMGDGEASQLYVTEFEQGGLKQLTSTPQQKGTACWSPDSNTICFSSGADGNSTLFTIPSKGGVPKQITIQGVGGAGEPDWSPDGKFIAFSTQGVSSEVYAVPSRGGVAVRLAEGTHPSWAANSHNIAFSRRQGSSSVISLTDMLSRRVVDIACSVKSPRQPAWQKE